mmetsp:Transcript_47114/g.117982  ORF Transcript_47114/g.117982 Transcript_47114/m.117982 type:complete len:294 (-) Transcript_47114:615-1496(-)
MLCLCLLSTGTTGRASPSARTRPPPRPTCTTSASSRRWRTTRRCSCTCAAAWARRTARSSCLGAPTAACSRRCCASSTRTWWRAPSRPLRPWGPTSTGWTRRTTRPPTGRPSRSAPGRRQAPRPAASPTCARRLRWCWTSAAPHMASASCRPSSSSAPRWPPQRTASGLRTGRRRPLTPSQWATTPSRPTTCWTASPAPCRRGPCRPRAITWTRILTARMASMPSCMRCGTRSLSFTTRPARRSASTCPSRTRRGPPPTTTSGARRCSARSCHTIRQPAGATCSGTKVSSTSR